MQQLTINDEEKIFLDRTEIHDVLRYELKHSAEEVTAELTLTIAVKVNQVGFEREP